jgi:hypothetical protein
MRNAASSNESPAQRGEKRDSAPTLAMRELPVANARRLIGA